MSPTNLSDANSAGSSDSCFYVSPLTPQTPRASAGTGSAISVVSKEALAALGRLMGGRTENGLPQRVCEEERWVFRLFEAMTFQSISLTRSRKKFGYWEGRGLPKWGESDEVQEWWQDKGKKVAEYLVEYYDGIIALQKMLTGLRVEADRLVLQQQGGRRDAGPVLDPSCPEKLRVMEQQLGLCSDYFAEMQDDLAWVVAKSGNLQWLVEVSMAAFSLVFPDIHRKHLVEESRYGAFKDLIVAELTSVIEDDEDGEKKIKLVLRAIPQGRRLQVCERAAPELSPQYIQLLRRLCDAC